MEDTHEKRRESFSFSLFVCFFLLYLIPLQKSVYVKGDLIFLSGSEGIELRRRLESRGGNGFPGSVGGNGCCGCKVFDESSKREAVMAALKGL